MLLDRYGRQITYLRVSVTDRCNMRCVYCMPPEGIQLQSHAAVMRYEEIAEVVRAAASQGIREVRLTGGEPLVRLDLAELVRLIAEIPGIEDMSLTTNGLLLGKYARSLADAGLRRVNVSLDTLRPDRFTRITRGADLSQVWQGLTAAEAAGLKPIKLNMVVMRGVNSDELIDLAQLTLEHDWHVRFIELMPVQNQSAWGQDFPSPQDAYFPIAEMLAQLAPLQLEPILTDIGRGPADEYRIPGAPGRLGFISPLSEPFCHECNRLRLTADGNLRPCLLSDIEIPVLPAIRRGESPLPLILQAVEQKPESHELSQNHTPSGRCMRQIGG